MPYIAQDKRTILDPHISELSAGIADHGQLAYTLYRLVLPSKRYEHYSRARAVLTDVYDVITEEFLAYEANKRLENGDIL